MAIKPLFGDRDLNNGVVQRFNFKRYLLMADAVADAATHGFGYVTETGLLYYNTDGVWVPVGQAGAPGLGIPVGGATNQALLKNSAADLDVGWHDVIRPAQVGVPNGVASLDSLGLVPAAQIPPIAITDTFVVGSQAAQLALTAQTGDVCIRTDIVQTFILQGSNPAVLANWVLMVGNYLVSFNGRTAAAVVPTAGDYSYSMVTGAAGVGVNNSFTAGQTIGGSDVGVPGGTSVNIGAGLVRAGAGFVGDGSLIVSINGSAVATGTVADARLSSNVALKNIDNAFSVVETFTNGITVGTTSPSYAQGRVYGSATLGVVVTSLSGSTWDFFLADRSGNQVLAVPAGTQNLQTVGAIGLNTAITAGNGLLQLASGTTKANGIAFGTDAFFYRVGAGEVAFTGTGTASIDIGDGTGVTGLQLTANTTQAQIQTYTNKNLVFRTNSTTALTIDTSQNATFAGSAYLNGALGMFQGGNAGNFASGIWSRNAAWGTYYAPFAGTTADLVLSDSAGTTTFTIKGAAVGLGTVAPTAGNGLLQLASGTTKANGVAFGTDTFLFRNSAGYLTLQSASAESALYVYDSTGATLGRLLANTSGVYVGSGTNKPVYIQTNGTAALTIDTSQNIGIGASSTGSRLFVTESTGNTAIFDSTHANGGYITFSKSGATVGTIGNASQLVAGAITDLAIRSQGALKLASNGGTVALTIDTSQIATFAGSAAGTPGANQVTIGGGHVKANLNLVAGDSIFCQNGTVTGYMTLGAGVFLGAQTAHPLYLRAGNTTGLTLDTSLNTTFAGSIIGPAGTAALAPLILPQTATAYTGGTNGAMWVQSDGLHVWFAGSAHLLATGGSGWAGSGSGTASRIVRWSGTTVLGDSSIVDNGAGCLYASASASNADAYLKVFDEITSAYATVYKSGSASTGYIGAGNGAGGLLVNGCAGYAGTYSAHDFFLGTNNAERMRITSAGVVDIGGTSAAAPAQGHTAIGLGAISSRAPTAGGHAYLQLYDETASGSLFIHKIGSSAASEFGLANGSATLYSSACALGVGSTSAHDVVLGSNNAERMRLTSAGLVTFTQANAPTGSLVTRIYGSYATRQLSNSSAEFSILPTSYVGTLTLPANFWVLGRSIMLRMTGWLSTSATPDLLTHKLKLGSTVLATTTGGTPPVNLSSVPVTIEATITCISTGVSGSVYGGFTFRFPSAAQNYSTTEVEVGNVGVATIDTTASAAIDFTSQWGTASSSNTITITQCNIDVRG